MFGYELEFAERCPEVAKQILQHEAGDAGTGVERAQDEERFKHNCEVIPERHHGGPAERMGEDLRHPDGERRCTAGARKERRFAHGRA